MAKLTVTATPSQDPILHGVIEEQEIRAVTYKLPGGLVHGFEWRQLVSRPATAQEPAREEWTPWVFGSKERVRQMLAQWDQFLETNDGTSPTSSVH